jgi:hypothetical protein
VKKCKSFAIDLMHFSANEVKEIKDLTALLEHIKECSACCEKLDKLRAVNTFSFLTKPRSAKYQDKMNKLIQRIRSESRSGNNTKSEIEQAAGKIYKCLKSNGKMPIQVIRKKTGLVDFPFYEAMGVLVTNEKVNLTKDKDGRPAYVSLNPGA